MGVKLRLARFGCRNLPFFRIYAAEARWPRDGKHLEVLGYYNPLPGKEGLKRIGIKIERVKYWLSVGAQPTEIVQHLLWKVGVLPPPPCPKLMSKDEAAKVVARMNEEDEKRYRVRTEKRRLREASKAAEEAKNTEEPKEPK